VEGSLKRLPASGAEPTPETMRGLTIPRPVHVTSIEHIGKEVIVDPTDTAEELTAERLSATEVLVYHDESKKHDALRAQILALVFVRFKCSSMPEPRRTS
jgi:hypothetical protein